MALSNIQDVTALFNQNNGYVQDLSGWDTIVIQFVAPTGTIAVTATNDDGSITGSVQGNGLTSTNYQPVQVTLLADGTTVTTIAAAGLYKAGVIGRFIKFGGTSAAATKVIIQLSKIF